MTYDSRVLNYFEFLRFSLNDTLSIPSSINNIDWDDLFTFGKEQAILGVLYHGIEKLSNSKYKPNRNIILKFYICYQSLLKANKQAFKDANYLTSLFKEKYNLNSCVLKGQANALMYPNPYLRVPGDIDLWVNTNAIDIIKIAKKYDPKAEIAYHHIQVNLTKTPIELHFFPSFMGNLFYEYRLRRYFNKYSEKQFNNRKELPNNLGYINCLTKDFDLIFQLSHLMHHFFFEGIGLRQMIDYYYLLHKEFTEKEKKDSITLLKHLNMYKFATAVMYIMKKILGIEDRYLITKPNERLGKILEREIILGGNFGFYDKRFNFSGKSVYYQYFIEIYRNLHFAIDYPSETIFGRPISRWWHIIYKAWLRHQLK